MRRALVTGASGFVGSHVVEALLAAGWRVRCLTRARSSRAWLEHLDVEYANGDLAGDGDLAAACADCACAVHAAGVVNATSARAYFAINRDGTRRLRDAAIAAGIGRFVHVSSLAARGPREAGDEHPLNAYGESKLAAERLLAERASEIETVIVRPPLVYGPRDRDGLTLTRMVLGGWFPMVHGGRQRLSSVHATDLARGIAALCEANAPRGTFSFTDGHDRDLAEWGEVLARAVGVDARRVSVPRVLMWLAAQAGELWGALTGRPATINRARLAHFLGKDWTVDDARARAEIGYRERYDLARGLTETVAWYQRAGWI